MDDKNKTRAIWEMARTDGWQHVAKESAAVRDAQVNRLRGCKPEDLQRIQGFIAGIEQVMNYVSAMCDRATREPS